jgi:tol-pal system protein YbgF
MNTTHTARYVSVTSTKASLGLLLAVLMVLSGCTTNPSKKAGEDSQYGDLYSGSTEVKRTNEAKKTAKTAEEAIALGDKAARKGEYDQAIFEYIKAMELSGGDATTLNKIGDIQNQMGNYTHAEQAYQLSLNLEPDNEHALEGLGLIQLRNRNYEKSKDNLSRALAIKPDLWRAHNALGTIADIQGDHATAQNHYRKSLLLKPDSLHVINNYGYSLYLSGEWNSALAEFRKAINISPNYERAWYNIGLVYTRQERFDDALGAFDNVMSRPKAYNDIGYICMINGDYPRAENYFRKAIKLSSTYYKKAHENLEKMQRLKDKKDSVATSREQHPAYVPDNGVFSGLSNSLNDSHTEDRSRTTGVGAGNTVTMYTETIDSADDEDHHRISAQTPKATNGNIEKAASRDSPGDTQKLAESEVNIPAPTIVSTKTDSKRSPDSPTKPPVKADASENYPVTRSPSDTTTSKDSASRASNTGNSDEADTDDTSRIAEKTDPASPVPKKVLGDQVKYRKALLILNRKGYAEAAQAFQAFLTEYPDSQYADNASYWLGEIHYVQKNYDEALDVLSNLVEKYPESPMIAEAQLKIGYLQYEKKNWAEARSALSLVVEEYPNSQAAHLADVRLKRMYREDL